MSLLAVGRAGALALALIGATLALPLPASAQTRPTGPCDIYAAAGHAVRGRAQHHARAVRVLQRAALPGQAPVGQRHQGHRRRPPRDGRLRRRGRAGRVLRQHDLLDHRPLRPVARSTTTSPRRRAAASAARAWAGSTTSRSPTWRRSRSAATRPTASSSSRAWACATTTPSAPRSTTSPRASTGSSTAGTTTAAAASTTATPRSTAATTATARWRPPTSATPPAGTTARAPARGS